MRYPVTWSDGEKAMILRGVSLKSRSVSTQASSPSQGWINISCSAIFTYSSLLKYELFPLINVDFWSSTIL